MMAGKASWLGTKNIKNGQLPDNWDFDMTRIDFTAWDTKQGWPHSSQDEIGLVMCYDQVSKKLLSLIVTIFGCRPLFRMIERNLNEIFILVSKLVILVVNLIIKIIWVISIARISKF